MIPLSSRIERIARVEPGRRAIAEGERRIDYGTLWAQARAFAAFLRASGIDAGDRVAVILPNCIEAVVACHGCWLAGAAIVPLNAQARARDIAPWLRHCAARCVVYQAGHRDSELALEAIAEPILRVATGTSGVDGASIAWADALAAAAPSAPVEYQASDLAMILYTSGTTGAPKGVMLSHANLAANVDSIVRYLELGKDDSIVSVLPFYYSYGASVLHTHLSVGAFLVIEANLVFPHLMVETMARERVSGFSGVPSTFLLLLNRVPLANYDLSSLRYLTQAGGAMAPATAQRLREALPQARLYIMYGQTEATARLAWMPPERLDEKPGAVGMPIDGVELVVRRENGQPADVMEVGEVHARGPNVMLGYWRNPEATAAVLQDGWLRTGDMGHFDADGFLYLAGRRSDMIKTGAHRVHPKDVEEAIAELPWIAEVAVVGVDDDTLGQVIKAFVVTDAEHRSNANAIKAHCRERLAAYKIPKFIEFVDALPKTASGKIRRTQLTATTEPREVS
ncbi:class I adenylate-forming enzyme family protein [Dokdonella immobilis]|uniref:Acyl-CoA synthetase (AMP-forming)/AMP-acid ligase II n=1 Tax=Dokdonella immobilis TaxID=578942 RepID=A0A1I4VG12_9GAMM|nr:class I adenylate-forming enzyme family protein [Dokdonella immobilis]SFN00066.1 Acyl-CoA synthetase (AMP-forming)/AMP-acid ligase II [Dokdonella immobilis]